ncbi:MAG: hypothetical protein R8M45_10735 [Ghiorsea sp.]
MIDFLLTDLFGDFLLAFSTMAITVQSLRAIYFSSQKRIRRISESENERNISNLVISSTVGACSFILFLFFVMHIYIQVGSPGSDYELIVTNIVDSARNMAEFALYICISWMIQNIIHLEKHTGKYYDSMYGK